MTDKVDYLVALNFWGEQLDPPSVTALLGVQPEKAYRKGDVRSVNRSTGAEIRAKIGRLVNSSASASASCEGLALLCVVCDWAATGWCQKGPGGTI